MFLSSGLSGPDLDATTWSSWAFWYGIGLFLFVATPGWLVLSFGLMWTGLEDWAASECWGCNAWPEPPTPGSP